MEHAQLISCLPDGLHWFSAQIFDYYIAGSISTGEFLRWFHMPNSDYIPAAECIVSQYVPSYVPGTSDGKVLGQFVG